MNQIKLQSSIFGLMLILLISCETRPKVENGEGFVNVNGGKIWYKVVGKRDNIPLLMLHGGPGFPSHYLNPLVTELSKERPVIVFDQLGCGRSERITDTTLMTVNAHVQQVKDLLSALDIKEFYLYGHSWGTMLGTDYYLTYGDGVKGLIFASPCLSSEMWVTDGDTLISMLPDSVQIILRNSINGVEQDSATLSSAIDIFFNNYYWRKQPLSANLDSAWSQMGYNVYEYMWGTSEFFVTGTLKDYNRTNDLNKISVPTLYITGEFDAARPKTVRYYQSLTPNSKLAIIKNAGHMTMHDNVDDDVKAIINFLSELDRKR